MKKDGWGNIPFGYKEDPKDSTKLVAIQKELADLDYVLNLINNGVGYKFGAEWLAARTGRSITPPGLRKIHAKRNKEDEKS